MTAHGGFKSAKARDRYLAEYDEVRALGPRPDAVHDVPTPFGTVRVYQHGPDGGVPVLLVHGFYLSSAMWWEQTAGLAPELTVYALDMPGQPGASVPSKAMSRPADGARTIDAVVGELGLHDVHLVGHSYGGWLATHTAALRPSRFATVTLVDPAGTVARPSARFWRSLALLLTRPRSARAGRSAAWVAGDPAPGSSVGMLADLWVAGFAAFGSPFRTPPLVFASRRLLRSVRLPVQVLLAGNTIHDSNRAARRISAVVPGWRYHLWPNASHALPAEVGDDVNARIRQFVTEHDPRN